MLCDTDELVLNSSTTDELGNLCHERMVGTLHKYESQQGGLHGDPVCGNKPCQLPTTSTVTLKELQWINTYLTQYLPDSDFQRGWEGQGSKFTSEAMEKSAMMARQSKSNDGE